MSDGASQAAADKYDEIDGMKDRMLKLKEDVERVLQLLEARNDNFKIFYSRSLIPGLAQTTMKMVNDYGSEKNKREMTNRALNFERGDGNFE